VRPPDDEVRPPDDEGRGARKPAANQDFKATLAPGTYQVMPPLSHEEYAALTSSIVEHGIQVPIVVDEDGTIIDGHHRAQIAADLGVDCPRRVVAGKADIDKRTLSFALNLGRRHLTREQRRGLIADSLRADPQLSDRQHAERTGAHHSTVGKIRAVLESTGEISQSETRVSADGRERPANRPLALMDRAEAERTTREIKIALASIQLEISRYADWVDAEGGDGQAVYDWWFAPFKLIFDAHADDDFDGRFDDFQRECRRREACGSHEVFVEVMRVARLEHLVGS
jgi:ParB-like chromosome segregation protein Spo0J